MVLALQAVVWIGGPILEAKPSAAGLAAAAHVESEGGSNCTRIHSHLDCLTCRAFSDGALAGSPPEAPVCNAGELAPAVVVADSPHARGLTGPFGPRAPPRA
jgi:hypothetical protein